MTPKFNPLPYVAILILCVACIMQTINAMDSQKRAEKWRTEAIKLSDDWQKIDAQNRATIKSYETTVNKCLVALKQ